MVQKDIKNRFNPRNAGAARFSQHPPGTGITNMAINMYPDTMNHVSPERDYQEILLRERATALAPSRRTNLLSNFAPSIRFTQPVPNGRNAFAM
jgi:hypothetical protein